jgi:peptidoglycan/LPS O-acetylase OafA/YrhL
MRALAVAFVLACHIGIPWLRAGFIGVDIFFVISGFVVTASVSGLRPQSLTVLLGHFYRRRIVRIAPALAVCLVVTAAFTVLFVPAAWLSETNHKTGIAAFFGLSNFLLAATSNDYFSPRTEFNPFTHTWSLGVEEQFYLIAPLFYFWWIGPNASGGLSRRVISAVMLLSVASLVCCAIWSTTNPQFAFYLIPSRFWELGSGMILFLTKDKWDPLVMRLSRAANTMCYVLCLGLLCASLVWTDPSHFPFPSAIGPVVASAGLIALLVGRADASMAAIFSNVPARSLGKISYSLYLWHWPVIVLFRWTVGLESNVVKVIAIALSLLLATTSYYRVELLVRRSPSIRIQSPRKVICVGLTSLIVLAGVVHLAFRDQPHISLSVTRDYATWYPDPQTSSTPPGNCRVTLATQPFGDGTVTIFNPIDCPQLGPTHLFVAGDSHSGAYAKMLQSFALRTGTQVRLYSMGGCAFYSLNNSNASAREGCAQFSRVLTEALAKTASKEDMLFLPSLRVPRYKDQWGLINSTTQPASAALLAERREGAIQEAVTELGKITAHGASVLFEAPTPLFKAPPFRCSDWFNSSNAICNDGFSVSEAEIRNRRAPALRAMQEVLERVPNVSIWDPLPILCPEDPCSAFDHGKPLFFDGDHLSGFGNQILTKPFTDYVLQVRERRASTPISR